MHRIAHAADLFARNKNSVKKQPLVLPPFSMLFSVVVFLFSSLAWQPEEWGSKKPIQKSKRKLTNVYASLTFFCYIIWRLKSRGENVGPIKNSIVFCYRHVFSSYTFFFSVQFIFPNLRVNRAFSPSQLMCVCVFFASYQTIRYLCHAYITLVFMLNLNLYLDALFSFLVGTKRVFVRDDKCNRFPCAFFALIIFLYPIIRINFC